MKQIVRLYSPRTGTIVEYEFDYNGTIILSALIADSNKRFDADDFVFIGNQIWEGVKPFLFSF